MVKPTSINIMGIEYEIKYPSRMGSGNSLFGDTNGDDRQIRIRRNLQGEALKGTLFHELIHAVFYVSGITQILEEDTEEAIARAIENALTPHIELKCLKEDI